MNKEISNTNFYDRIIDVLQKSKHEVVRSVNQTMVLTYFEIGRLIVEEEQNGKERADYGKELLNGLSKKLKHEFGKGFSVKNLERMRLFYQIYKKSSTVLTILQGTDNVINKSDGDVKLKQSSEFNLSWSHYLTLMRIDDQNERNFYEIEAFKNNWSVRELQRQYNSAIRQWSKFPEGFFAAFSRSFSFNRTGLVLLKTFTCGKYKLTSKPA